MKRNRFGKIVATVGPASNTPDMLEKLFIAGVDVFRLNFSHGTHEGHEAVYNAIRALSKKYNHHPCILADMQGPKLRVGTFENDKVELKAGDIFRFDLDKTPGNEKRVNLPHKEILEALKVGSTLLLDDGKLKMEVVDRSDEYAEAKVIVGGVLSNRKGVNVPDVVLPIPALTEKDLKDLEFALQLGVDWVALSFVQSVEDVINAKKIINGRARVVSKLEKPSAIDDLDAIVEASDAIMIARGDLAVEMSYDLVPVIQRQILDTCHRIGRPVIVATQMLESMITLPTPTRAEASDVATAVYCGGDATMLSAEAASGSYPFEAVSTMSKVIETVECDPRWRDMQDADCQYPEYTVLDGCSAALGVLSEFSSASAIVTFTEDINTVIRCSRMRPYAPIIVATTSLDLVRQCGLIWGCHAVLIQKLTGCPIEKAREIVKSEGFAEKNDPFIIFKDEDTPMISVAIA